MLILFELVKECDILPQREVIATLQAEDICFEIIDINNDVIIIETFEKNLSINSLSERLSMVFQIDEFLFSSKPSLTDLIQQIHKHPINASGSIAVHSRNRSLSHDSRLIIQVLAQKLTIGRKVNLDQPDIDIRVVITDSKWYIGRKLGEIYRSKFEQRRVHYRPYFSPISLHPKLARAMVNLSCIKRNGILLDPFCGTGGILLEAGLIGVQVIGNDIEKKMIDGCKKTLRHYAVQPLHLNQGDIDDLCGKITMVDAIVTDLPYGKSTTTQGETLKNLYTRAFLTFAQLIKKGGKIVVGCSIANTVELASQSFKIIAVYPLKVHSSMTRYIIQGQL